MTKLDLTKQHKTYFTARTKPELVDIGPAQFLSIKGKGDPSGEAFAENIQAMYPAAYTIKFHYKSLDKDFTVSKLEGLWWYDEERFKDLTMEEAVNVPRSEWEYRLLIRMPDYVTEQVVAKSIKTVVEKKNISLANNIELFRMHEGRSVQMLHVGPFDTEPESLQVINDFCKKNNLSRNGLHHEIYLSDFRKTAPEKLKTILREPVKD